MNDMARVTYRRVWENDKSVIQPYQPSYDTSNFVNEGEFFDKHPGVIPNVKCYIRYDSENKVIESWARDDNGVMIETTQRDKLREELIAAQEALAKLNAKENPDEQQ
jgi:hypothetical protein